MNDCFKNTVSAIYIYVVRHGQTDWNIEGRLQGLEDIPLNETGIAQAHECGKALSILPISSIYSSPLSRALDTANIIGEHTCGKTAIADNDLTERDFGNLSGKAPTTMDIFNPGENSTLEPIDVVSQRFIRALKKHAEPHAVFVSHGGSINSMLLEISGGEIGSGKTRLINGAINILALTPVADSAELDYTFEIAAHNLSSAELPDAARRLGIIE